MLKKPTSQTARRSPGRPPVSKPKNLRLSLAIDQETMDALFRKAETADKPVSEIARSYIEDGVRARR